MLLGPAERKDIIQRRHRESHRKAGEVELDQTREAFESSILLVNSLLAMTEGVMARTLIGVRARLLYQSRSVLASLVVIKQEMQTYERAVVVRTLRRLLFLVE